MSGAPTGRRPAFSVPRRKNDEAGAPASKATTQHQKGACAPAARTRTPLGASVADNSAQCATDTGSAAFKVLYTARSNKRRNNKSWSGLHSPEDDPCADGFIAVTPDGASWAVELFSEEGKPVCKRHVKVPVNSEDALQLGNWDLEVDNSVPAASLVNGSAFLGSSAPPIATTAATRPMLAPPTARQMQPLARRPGGGVAPARANASGETTSAIPEGAHLLQSGTDGGKAVYIDAFLVKHLRPHQLEGVQFLYDCVAGRQRPCSDGAAASTPSASYYGGILADEMGLGKTLQVLATSWTLMQRGGPFGKAAVRKMLVVAPSSVIKNWGNEIHKWLGMERAAYLVLLPGKEATGQVTAFRSGHKWRILIASYENIRKHCELLQGAIDLLICDEGHRLKSSGGSTTMSALLQLNCPRRIILTGTPVQNNLKEFFFMMSFVNPGLLGTQSAFQRVFAAPIEASRETDASPDAVACGAARAEELSRIIAPFQLRRTSDVNSKYLPSCLQYVVMCPPTAAQIAAYERVLGEDAGVGRLLGARAADSTQVLALISKLRQVCNHPDLAGLPAESDEENAGEGNAPAPHGDPAASSKLLCLQRMLEHITAGGEKAVAVSTSTRMLDLAQGVCAALGLNTGRIDGSTAAASRQELVDAFNSPSGTISLFLLSTRAGGAGLNLIGGSRLFLLDSDWNPAMDAQAMARIWRDGQKRTCSIYRLLTTGLIDEKMFQRQLYKEDLVGFVGRGAGGGKGGGKGGSFSQEELRKLFEMNLATACDTKDTLAAADAAAGAAWVDGKDTVDDAALRAAVQAGAVSFVHLQAVKGGGAVQSGGADESSGQRAAARSDTHNADDALDETANGEGRRVRQRVCSYVASPGCAADPTSAALESEDEGSQGGGLQHVHQAMLDDSDDDFACGSDELQLDEGS